MVLLINQLVDAGLLDRRAARGDRRAFALSLTAAGERTLADATARIAVHEARMLVALTPAERAALIALLDRIADGPPVA